MLPRTEYEMSEADLAELLAACKPVPMIMLQCGTPPSPQENANNAWARLGEKLGFDGMTVRPIQGKGQRFFTAVPTETMEARDEREAEEAQAQLLKQILRELAREARNEGPRE